MGKRVFRRILSVLLVLLIVIPGSALAVTWLDADQRAQEVGIGEVATYNITVGTNRRGLHYIWFDTHDDSILARVSGQNGDTGFTTDGGYIWIARPDWPFVNTYDFTYEVMPADGVETHHLYWMVLGDDFPGWRTNITTGIEFVAVSPVPEPSTFLLLTIGLVGLIGYSRFKRRKNNN
ncbi:MAG: PEP-CTERM sorting domain-containing protein [Halobacteriota archaeon]|nr:PEP-CTERM sorting domain-containing protein [Halobacteriota archaeon]